MNVLSGFGVCCCLEEGGARGGLLNLVLASYFWYSVDVFGITGVDACDLPVGVAVGWFLSIRAALSFDALF